MIDPTLWKKVRQIEIQTGRLVEDVLAGAYHSAFKGQGMELDDVRAYQPGDPIRSIDWNVTARTGQAHVKTFREERQLTVYVAIDLSASTRFGSGSRSKRDLVAQLAALLALAAIRNDDRIGLVAFTDRIERYVPPKKGRRHALRIVREVLSCEPAGRGTRLDEVLGFLGRVVRRRAVVFLVSDWIAEGYDRALAAGQAKHDLIAVRVRDPLEDALPQVGLVTVEDPETGDHVLVDTRSRKVRERFAAQSAQKAEQTAHGIRRRGIDLLDLRTDRPYLQALRAFLKARARRLFR